MREATDRPVLRLASVGALLTLWSASGAFASMGESLNAVFDVEDKRNFIKRCGIALAFALGVGIVLLFAAVALLAGPEIAAAAGVSGVFAFAQWPIVFGMIAAVLYAVYRFLPAAYQPQVKPRDRWGRRARRRRALDRRHRALPSLRLAVRQLREDVRRARCGHRAAPLAHDLGRRRARR